VRAGLAHGSRVRRCGLVWAPGRAGLAPLARVPVGHRNRYAAAHCGHLEVLRYAHEHGCPWDIDTCLGATQGGHLEVLRYAHEHGCPWDIDTCLGATQGGHLEVLRYAHEHGCQWGRYTCAVAAEGGHLELLR
jgi:hypothetical protein